MRIAITGATGIGKTTLARALGDRLGLPVLEEDLKKVEQSLIRLVAARGGSRGRQQKEWVEICRQECFNWLDRRQTPHRSHPESISDRCSIDILSRWLMFDLSVRDNAATGQILRRCRELLDELDLIVIPPLPALRPRSRTRTG